MILVFHFICLLARYIVKNVSKSLSNKILSEDDEDAKKSNILDLQNRNYVKHPVYENGTLRFFPPVYVQRYETVALILKDPIWEHKIKKVVDFGCSELGFFAYLKNTESVTEILEVDIDSELLERHSHKAAPLTCDYLMSRGSKPLDVYILAGSVANFDDCLIGCDAVVAIELIEHLSEEAFNNMPYNIFHKIRPKLAIFTTPNADFNSLFPNFKSLRHKDHRFEWSRKEFYNWSQDIINRYPDYSVRFYGIGAGPEGTENLGCCSQMAVFQRSEDSESFSSARDTCEGFNNYKLIQHYKYPVYVDTRTTEEKVIHEIQYQVTHLHTLPTYYSFEVNESEIPLSFLKEFVAHLCPNDEDFRNILVKNGMLLRKRNMSWFLVHTDEEICSSVSQFGDEDWLNEEVLENFSDREMILFEEPSWDEEFNLMNLANKVNYQSVKSLEGLETNHYEKKTLADNVKKKCNAKAKDTVKSAPPSYNHLSKKLDFAMEALTTKNNNTYFNNNYDNNYNNSERTRLFLARSRIPRKRNGIKRENHSPERNIRKTTLSYSCSSLSHEACCLVSLKRNSSWT